jgi:hypothetical protein
MFCPIFHRDVKNIEFNFYKTGHFAFEEFGDDIAERIDVFLHKMVHAISKFHRSILSTMFPLNMFWLYLQ